MQDNEFVFTMDEDGNIEASQSQAHATQNPLPAENVDTEFDNDDDAMLLEAAEDSEFIVEFNSEQSSEEQSDDDLLAAVEELEASVSEDT